MNQFVPIFLGQQKPPWKPPRVADTQKCIRAGGKHNDLEDVGLDTYHHTFFEMLGNWSFGDYFKKEAIEWAWELLVERWKFPPQRLYATVYQPGPDEPSEFDQEAYDHWAHLFREADLDPKVHVLSSGKADNFWMMGDTGPCGPCSEVHIDLTPDGDTRGALVNKNDPRCIEIWNLVFIQFNAQPVAGGGDPGHIELSPAATSRRYRNGFRARRSNHSRHKESHRFFRNDFELRDRRFSPDLRRARKTERQKIRQHAADCRGAHPSRVWRSAARRSKKSPRATATSTPAACAPQNKFKSMSPFASSPITSVRFRSRLPTESFRQTKVAVMFCVGSCVAQSATDARLVFTSRSFSNLSTWWRKRWATSFPKSGRNSQGSKKQFAAKKKPLTKHSTEASSYSTAKLRAFWGARRSPSPLLRHSAGCSHGARYTKRRLPHYERPHGLYHVVTFSTRDHRVLSPEARVSRCMTSCILDQKRYDLYAACVMPDHVHILLQPPIAAEDAQELVFWSLSDIMHSKSRFLLAKLIWR